MSTSTSIVALCVYSVLCKTVISVLYVFFLNLSQYPLMILFLSGHILNCFFRGEDKQSKLFNIYSWWSVKMEFTIVGLHIGPWWLLHRFNIPVENGSNSYVVRTVTLKLRGQENSIFQGNRAMGERGDEELIPPWQFKCTCWWGMVSTTTKRNISVGLQVKLDSQWRPV